MTIYYAHSRLIYGSPLESYNIETIKRVFGNKADLSIINPADFDQLRPSEEIMDECLATLDDCDVLVFSTLDLMIGRGVYREIEYFENRGNIFMLWDNRLWLIDNIDILINPYDKMFYASVSLPFLRR